MKLSQLKTDRSKEEQGTWVDAGGGLRLRISRSTSDLYRATVTKMLRPHQQTIRRGLQDPALMAQISKDAAAQALLHDWENLQDDDGKPIPFSREYARKIFDSHPDFFALVIELAENAELFREDAMGNSPTSSAGS